MGVEIHPVVMNAYVIIWFNEIPFGPDCKHPSRDVSRPFQSSRRGIEARTDIVCPSVKLLQQILNLKLESSGILIHFSHRSQSFLFVSVP